MKNSQAVKLKTSSKTSAPNNPTVLKPAVHSPAHFKIIKTLASYLVPKLLVCENIQQLFANWLFWLCVVLLEHLRTFSWPLNLPVSRATLSFSLLPPTEVSCIICRYWVNCMDASAELERFEFQKHDVNIISAFRWEEEQRASARLRNARRKVFEVVGMKKIAFLSYWGNEVSQTLAPISISGKESLPQLSFDWTWTTTRDKEEKFALTKMGEGGSRGGVWKKTELFHPFLDCLPGAGWFVDCTINNDWLIVKKRISC